MDMQLLKTKMQRCKNAGSIYYHKGRRVATFNPLPIEKRALAETQEIMQHAGAGAMFNVYQSLAERYRSLIVLLPVAQSITDQAIAQAMQRMQLVIANDGKMYCLGWYYGILSKRAKLDVAEMFQDNAEQAIRDVREMLVYALHLIQTAQAEMQAYQRSERYREKITNWEIVKKHLNFPSLADTEIENQKRNIPNGGADLLSVEDERIYNFVTSAYAKQIADSEGAYSEHQAWRRELLLSLGEDSAGSGGLTTTMGR
ncbi:MAG: hypothetical protein M0Z70_05185 [Nitrospiraceae bacterium]|nr:hypothetical protein [Nitrospiraceae bacterium]